MWKPMICSSVDLLFLISVILLLTDFTALKFVRLEGARSMAASPRVIRSSAGGKCQGGMEDYRQNRVRWFVIVPRRAAIAAKRSQGSRGTNY